jgi:hypothetical protein
MALVIPKPLRSYFNIFKITEQKKDFSIGKRAAFYDKQKIGSGGQKNSFS